VVADAFTGSARTKIEAAGGAVSVLEIPTAPMKAIGLDDDDATPPVEAAPAKPRKAKASAAAEPVEEETTEPDAADTDAPDTTESPVAADEPASGDDA
jgi:hypothetical protein